MPVYFDKAKRCWRFTFNRVVAGKRIRATKLLPQGWGRAEAQAYDQRETKRLYDIATGSPSEHRTIEEAVELYCRERLPKLKAWRKQLGELAQCHWAYAGRTLDELPEVAREYIATAVREVKNPDGTVKHVPLSDATKRNRMAYVRAACRYAFKYHDWGEHDPAERLSLPMPKNERQFYATRAEVLRICRKISNLSARAAVLIAFYSGMRLAEVLRCKVVDGVFVLDDTKNGNPRIVPVHSKLKTYLHRVPITAAYRTIQGCHKRACQAVGLGHLTYHDMRHSAASEMINAGVDLYTVGGVLGHVSPISTKRYAHLATESLAAAVESIGKARKAK